MNSPILLQATMNLTNLQVKECEQTLMQNPFRTAMYVDEFRFHAKGIPNGSAPDTPILWANDLVQIYLGRTPLTNGFVPMGLLSTMIQDGGAQYGDTQWTWKLRKPLYVPPTEQLIIRCANQPNAIAADNTGQQILIGVAGRSLDERFPRPATINMPWAAAYMTPTATIAPSYATFQSADSDLVNPFAEDMQVERFVGRCLSADAAGSGFDGATAIGTTVRAHDSFGTILVRDPAPFANLFYYGTRSWTVNSRLAPKGFYLFNLIQDFTQVLAESRREALGIAMLGNREVRLK